MKCGYEQNKCNVKEHNIKSAYNNIKSALNQHARELVLKICPTNTTRKT